MGQYGTSLDVMRTAAQRVDQVSAELNAELSALRGQLEPLAGQWRGPAQAAFVQLMDRWATDAAGLQQALHGISDSLGSAQRNYAGAEEQNSAAINRITSALGGGRR